MLDRNVHGNSGTFCQQNYYVQIFKSSQSTKQWILFANIRQESKKPYVCYWYFFVMLCEGSIEEVVPFPQASQLAL